MIKNAIRLRYNVIKALIEKYTPPIDLSGFGEVILENIDFTHDNGSLTVQAQTSGTIRGTISVIGKLRIDKASDHIIFDVSDIKFIKLPLALKLTAGLLKQKIIGIIEEKAKISSNQLQAMINGQTKSLLNNLAAGRGIDAKIELSDLNFEYVQTDDEGIEICTEIEVEPKIEIKELSFS